MPAYKNNGDIPRILLTQAGEYIRLAPGVVSANIKLDVKNPVIAAYLKAGDLLELKPKTASKATDGTTQS
ncbi:MAG: hypothetical protein HKN36_09170 [Hellea sp.]|nr:hypothetical protein [Hellea sp.]